MNIQIYCHKKNFDVQKAERFFKERRIPYQMLDLKKHRLGEREVRLMISAIGPEELIDRTDRKVREHPACYYDRPELLIPAIQENPWLIKGPIVRNGNEMTTGFQPETWTGWQQKEASK